MSERAAAGRRYRRQGLPDGDPRHGTTNGYSNRGCRCQPCRDANSAEAARQRVERRESGLPPGDPRHGTAGGYQNWFCRCVECTAAATRDRRAWARRHRAGAQR